MQLFAPVLCFPRGYVIREVVRLKQAEEDGDDTKDAGGAGDLEGSSSAVRVRAAAAAVAITTTVAAGRRASVLGAGATEVSVLTTASESTLDDRVALVLLELRADIGKVLLGLEVESTTNVLEGREVGTRVDVSICAV